MSKSKTRLPVPNSGCVRQTHRLLARLGSMAAKARVAPTLPAEQMAQMLGLFIAAINPEPAGPREFALRLRARRNFWGGRIHLDLRLKW